MIPFDDHAPEARQYVIWSAGRASRSGARCFPGTKWSAIRSGLSAIAPVGRTAAPSGLRRRPGVRSP